MLICILDSHCLNVEDVYVYIASMFYNSGIPIKHPQLFGCLFNVLHMITKVNDSSLCLSVYLFCVEVDNK